MADLDIDESNDLFADYNSEPEYREEEPQVDNLNSEDADNAETSQVIPVPKKRVVRNPRLKFDPDRLCGERGIPILLDHFKDTKFKGKGYEEKDLDTLLSTLEHWTHRLFPSMKFKDSLKQIEKLGKKRPVQTCLNKIRLDMPILFGDFVQDDDRNDVRNDDTYDPDAPTESAFDQLLGEHDAQNMSDTLNTSVRNSFEDDALAPQEEQSNNGAANRSSSCPLTEEQRERMERNRQLAAEKRKARLAAMNLSHEVEGNESQQNNESTAQVSTNIDDSNGIAQIDEPSIDQHDEAHIPDATESSGVEEPIRKPAKRLRIDSSSDEDMSIDDLVDNSLYDANDSVVPDSVKNSEQQLVSVTAQKNSYSDDSDFDEIPSITMPDIQVIHADN